MKYKFKVFDYFKIYKAEIKTFIGRRIKIIWSDGGGKNKFNQFKELCEENEIRKQMTTTYTLEQNKVAKSKKLTLVENAWCIKIC
jgi:D-arabinose 1-dehydrogenase-like Zn-dependent alcohol dehydrogenase